MIHHISVFGYGLAAAAFLSLVVAMATVWRSRMSGSVLPFACGAAAFWGLALAASGLQTDVSAIWIYMLEIGHDFVWLLFLSILLGGSITQSSNWLVRYGGVALSGLLLLVGILAGVPGIRNLAPSLLGDALVLGSIATSLYALVGVEQVYRNSRPGQQNALKMLCLGIAGLFVYDLVLYSNAVVAGRVSTLFWDVRGFVAALCVPLIALSVRRLPNWSQGLFISRQVVFYSTTLVGGGMYLAIVGLAGYYIQQFGQQWGAILQVVFFAAAALAFILILLSDQIRSRVSVFVAKHFFERKYDYRAEWLRLIGTLTRTDDGLPLKKRAIKALAQIVGSSSGRLWLVDPADPKFVPASSWNVRPSESELSSGSDLPAFLATTGWVLDLVDVDARPQNYRGLTIEVMPEELRSAGYAIPLMHEGLLGFVVLQKTNPRVELNFEDHDLLKTAGRQIASYLAQEAATEQLAENRQFEAYSRFTAYVMHDLKNAIAQQSLVVKNAEKHRRNPDFVDDAIETIRGSVKRMSRVLEQLKQRTVDEPTERVDLRRLVAQAGEHCGDRSPSPVHNVPDGAVTVLASRDRLFMALCHAIRNAQDATSAEEGRVEVSLRESNGSAVIAVSDNGKGMEPEFVRDRLFRPFDSTKGAEGMGIGAYQIRETIRMIGGDVTVESAQGEGTTIELSVPLASVPDGEAR